MTSPHQPSPNDAPAASYARGDTDALQAILMAERRLTIGLYMLPLGIALVATVMIAFLPFILVALLGLMLLVVVMGAWGTGGWLLRREQFRDVLPASFHAWPLGLLTVMMGVGQIAIGIAAPWSIMIGLVNAPPMPGGLPLRFIAPWVIGATACLMISIGAWRNFWLVPALRELRDATGSRRLLRLTHRQRWLKAGLESATFLGPAAAVGTIAYGMLLQPTGETIVGYALLACPIIGLPMAIAHWVMGFGPLIATRPEASIDYHPKEIRGGIDPESWAAKTDAEGEAVELS